MRLPFSHCISVNGPLEKVCEIEVPYRPPAASNSFWLQGIAEEWARLSKKEGSA